MTIMIKMHKIGRKRESYKEQERKEGMMGGREGGFYLFLLVYTYM